MDKQIRHLKRGDKIRLNGWQTVCVSHLQYLGGGEYRVLYYCASGDVRSFDAFGDDEVHILQAAEPMLCGGMYL